MGNALDTCCLPQHVKVVTTEGTVVGYSGEIVKAKDVLQTYPHHYLTEAGQETSMLGHDEVLKAGNKYVLHPVPRLFNVGTCHNSDDKKLPCVSYTCCLCIATGGFSTSELSDSSNDDSPVRREGRGVETWSSPTSKMCVDKTSDKTATEQINGSAPKICRLPTSKLPVGLQELLKSAEIEWQEIADLNKAWRPDLESIKEEPMKSPMMLSPMMSPMLRSPIRTRSGRRPSLATLMKLEARPVDDGEQRG